MEEWEDNEKHMPEQAALAYTCEQYGIDYMRAEWVGIVQVVEYAERHPTNASTT